MAINFNDVLGKLANNETFVSSTKTQKDAIIASAGVKIVEVTDIPKGVDPHKEGWLTAKTENNVTFFEVTNDNTAQEGQTYYMAVRRTFTEFCDYLKAVNYCVTPTKKLLCEVGGMTAADYTQLTNALDIVRYCILDWRSTKRLLDDTTITKSKGKAVMALVEDRRSNVYGALKLIKALLGVDIKATPSDIEWLAGRCITAKYRNTTDIKSGYKFEICGSMTVLANIFKLFSAQSDADTALENNKDKFKNIKALIDNQK